MLTEASAPPVASSDPKKLAPPVASGERPATAEGRGRLIGTGEAGEDCTDRLAIAAIAEADSTSFSADSTLSAADSASLLTSDTDGLISTSLPAPGVGGKTVAAASTLGVLSIIALAASSAALSFSSTRAASDIGHTEHQYNIEIHAAALTNILLSVFKKWAYILSLEVLHRRAKVEGLALPLRLRVKAVQRR